MRIAIFDHIVAPRSPPGRCDMRVIEALRGEHEVTVFASELALAPDNRNPVGHVPIRTVRRPALVAFLFYLVQAYVNYWRLRLAKTRFDLVQATDCSFPTADVCYAHFCHRFFLRHVWPEVRGRITPRTIHSWAGHAVRALIEVRLVRRARVIVVPSSGLARDFERMYPETRRSVRVIRNVVDLDYFRRPASFAREPVRERLGTGRRQTAFVFVAHGHFERKGLPLLLDAVTAPALGDVRVWVVGGEPGLVAAFRATALHRGIDSSVVFVGRTEDVRPFLWSADAFVAPSHYEAFSLGLLEAAAAGLPLIATRVSGSEELIADGVNGIYVERSTDGVRAGILRFLDLDACDREAMASAARASVEPLSAERFAAAWQSLYTALARSTVRSVLSEGRR
jgi:glycosyltransferase involved in cell wall biosynthesis